ncbi:MAG: hypothetical protein JJV95_04335 [Sulfurospirillum sp.]|nr:hypothetical protein [Sulfurospirillum sp.]MBL0703190.1 hypothetical protein [Sulfurospirillum sp.]
MAVSPLGSVIYTNQNTQTVATKQTSFQNRVEMQNILAGTLFNEKDTVIKEIRPAEETHKIDPDKQHEKKKKEEESKAKDNKKDAEEKNLKKNKDNSDPSISLLDVIA